MATISHTTILPVQSTRIPHILFIENNGILWLKGDNLSRAKKLLGFSADQKNVGFDSQTAQIYIDDLMEQGVTVGIIRGNTMRTIIRQQTSKPEKVEHRTVWLAPTFLFDVKQLSSLKHRLNGNGSTLRDLVETMKTQIAVGDAVKEYGSLYVFQVAENLYEVDELTSIPKATVEALAVAAYETGSLLCCQLVPPKSKRVNGQRQTRRPASIQTSQFVVSEPTAYGQLRFEM